MEFGRAFSYIMEDPNWLKKVGIAGLVMLIPLIGTITVLGWSLEITRRVINNDPQPLPDWSDFGGFLSKGFQAFVIGFAYALPIIIISACGNGITAIAANVNSDSAAQVVTGLVSVVSICAGCFTFLYELALSVVLPAAFGNFVASGQLGAGFRFNEVFGLVRAAPGPYLLVLVGSLVVGLLIPFGLIACIIGVIFTAAFGYAVMGNLYGQAYRAAKAAQGLAPIQ